MSELRGLAGRKVVVTRPAPQAAELLGRLQAIGADSLFFPVIDIAPLADSAPLLELGARLSEFDLAFFVSRNAVAQTLAVLPRPLWPASLQVATVGPGSAADLCAAGFENVLLPTGRFDSEGVLALPDFSAPGIAGRRVLILRGNGGRELLAETLAGRGAMVEVHGCYRRVAARTDPAPLRSAWAGGQIGAFSFTSSEGARNFAALLGDEAAAMLASAPCFVPHERISQQLRALGAQAVVLTAAGDAAFVAAVQEHFG